MPVSALTRKNIPGLGVLSALPRRKIGRAMAEYDMLADGDRVLVAVSGGIDSLVLARVLHLWRQRAPIDYTLRCVHVDMQAVGDGIPGPVAAEVKGLLADMGLVCDILPANWQPERLDTGAAAGKDVCFQCSRNRRTLLFDHARRNGFDLLALGHHRDDIIETFFLNLTRAGNLSTMLPRQDLFSGRLSLVRPLAYLSKDEVEELGQLFSLTPVRSQCPLSEQTSRRQVQKAIAAMETHLPDARSTIFAALANLRPDYLLDARYRRSHADRA